MLGNLQIDLIDLGNRLRPIDADQVQTLINSIGDVGLLNAITVYKKPVIRDNVSLDGYGLIAGAHRLEACKRLGLADIPAQIVELSDLERQIAECDENLCGTKLTPSERATFIHRRKEAYEALHPETKHGAIGRNHLQSRKFCDSEAERFTADTAASTGISERLVQLNAERGEKIIPEVMDMIKGTPLDSGVYLDKLKRLPPNEQVVAAKRDLAIAKSKKDKPFKIADEPVSDEEAKERQVATLMSAWNRASPEAREEFLERIERPVFDRGRAA